MPKLPSITVPGVYTAPAAPPSGGTGTSGPGSGRAFSWGGVLPGYAPGIDSIHALLSPGEAVLVPEAVALLGPEWIYQVNHLASGGRAPLQRFSWGGVVGDALGAAGSAASGVVSDVTGFASGVANAALAPLIHEAESVAHTAAHALIPAGIFRDLADGTIDMLGSAAKFSVGGLATPWSGSAGTAIGDDGASVAAGNTYQLSVENHHRALSGRDVVTALGQMHALHGQPLLAGSGFGG